MTKTISDNQLGAERNPNTFNCDSKTLSTWQRKFGKGAREELVADHIAAANSIQLYSDCSENDQSGTFLDALLGQRNSFVPELRMRIHGNQVTEESTRAERLIQSRLEFENRVHELRRRAYGDQTRTVRVGVSKLVPTRRVSFQRIPFVAKIKEQENLIAPTGQGQIPTSRCHRLKASGETRSTSSKATQVRPRSRTTGPVAVRIAGEDSSVAAELTALTKHINRLKDENTSTQRLETQKQHKRTKLLVLSRLKENVAASKQHIHRAMVQYDRRLARESIKRWRNLITTGNEAEQLQQQALETTRERIASRFFFLRSIPRVFFAWRCFADRQKETRRCASAISKRRELMQRLVIGVRENDYQSNQEATSKPADCTRSLSAVEEDEAHGLDLDPPLLKNKALEEPETLEDIEKSPLTHQEHDLIVSCSSNNSQVICESMERRAALRRQRREQLKQRYAKLQQQKEAELERQRKEQQLRLAEEKRLLREQARAKRQEAVQKERERVQIMQQERENRIKADTRYRRSLMQRRGLVPWKAFVLLQKGREVDANHWHQHRLLQHSWIDWRAFVRKRWHQREQEERKKLRIASNHYAQTLRRQFLRRWQTHHRRFFVDRELAVRRQQEWNLLWSKWKLWRAVYCDVKIVSREKEIRARTFTQRALARHTFRAWREQVHCAVTSRILRQEKEELWQKVRHWLNE